MTVEVFVRIKTITACEKTSCRQAFPQLYCLFPIFLKFCCNSVGTCNVFFYFLYKLNKTKENNFDSFAMFFL